jgi:curved DNA-binding protein CbpA
MENKLIDPYGLLGVDSRSSLGELKKNYYNLALLCHPDKGGNDKDMNVVSLAYNYIKDHLENVKETTYEKLEEEFADFCKGQEILKPPTFGQIYEETSDWINEFNKKFEEGLNTSGDMRQFIGGEDEIYDNPYLKENNPMSSGYGEYMEVSSNAEPIYAQATDNDLHVYDVAQPLPENEYDLAKGGDEDEHIYEEVSPQLPEDGIYIDVYIPNETETVKNEFTREIMEYKEPEYLPDTITSFPLDGQEISDYSGQLDNVRMSDYRLAFCPPEELPEVEERDYPPSDDKTSLLKE